MCFIYSPLDEVSIWCFTFSCSVYFWDIYYMGPECLHFISFLSNSRLPVAYSVWTFYVSINNVSFTTFSFPLAVLLSFVFIGYPVANFSTLLWSLSSGRRIFSTGRRLGRHTFLLFVLMVGIYYFFLFPNSGIYTPLYSMFYLKSELAIGTKSQNAQFWWNSHRYMVNLCSLSQRQESPKTGMYERLVQDHYMSGDTDSN